MRGSIDRGPATQRSRVEVGNEASDLARGIYIVVVRRTARAGVSMASVAEQAGISAWTFCHLRDGRAPQMSTVIGIAKALAMTPAKLIAEASRCKHMVRPKMGRPPVRAATREAAHG